MPKQWDTWMVAFAGGLVGVLASIGHIIVDRSAIVAGGPVPIGQVALYVFGVAVVFAVVSMVRNRLVMRRGQLPTTSR